jgi:hypothetical protein
MKKILFLFLLFTFISSYSPEPTPMHLIEICENTGGEIIETYEEIDCGPDCRAMPLTHSDCVCPDGITYMNINYMYDFQGCTGEPAVCFDDYGCVRTNQGNKCILETGECVFDENIKEDNSLCIGSSVFMAFFIVVLALVGKV